MRDPLFLIAYRLPNEKKSLKFTLATPRTCTKFTSVLVAGFRKCKDLRRLGVHQK